MATQVALETNHGRILIELDEERAPQTAANFLQYVDDGHYDATVFHRVVAGFVIQGGGFTESKKEKKTRASIPNESKNGVSNAEGTLAMARTPDPHSASAQFFINLKGNEFLDAGAQGEWGYAVFGHVAEGMDIVHKIGDLPTRPQGGAFGEAPADPVIIQSAKRV